MIYLKFRAFIVSVGPGQWSGMSMRGHVHRVGHARHLYQFP